MTKRIAPGPGQESVWDYPRPPAVEPVAEVVRIEHAGREIARTTKAWRVLETSHPPTLYLPPSDIDLSCLRPNPAASSFCEWKGQAHYFDLVLNGLTIPKVAWAYTNPTKRFADIADHLAFYPSKVDACFVGDQRVTAQAGDFYGGWITPNIVGPFKGGPGTWGW